MSATPTDEQPVDWNRATAVAAARQAIMWAGVPVHEAERYAFLAVDAIAHAGLMLPNGTETVEQFGYRITRDGEVIADVLGNREQAQIIVRNHAANREEDPRWRGDASVIRRHQHTTPWERVEQP